MKHRLPRSSYRVLPGAVEWIQQTLADLQLRPQQRSFTPSAAIRQQARFYMTPVVDHRGRLAWFKATLRLGLGLRQGLREEIRVQRAFADYERRFRPRFDSPSFIASHDNHRGFVWLLRKYWLGVFAGDMSDNFGLSPLFFRHVSAAMMAGVLADVRKMTPFFKRRLSMDQHTLGWYLLDFHYYQRHFFRPLLNDQRNPGWRRDDIDRMEEIFHQHRSFFAQHATTFTHGDFYPNNIMVRPGANRPVVLFDWELSHLNLSTFDAVMMYLQAWRRPVWQENFRRGTIKSLGDTPTTRTAWRLATLSLATRLAAFCFIRLTNGQPDRYPRLPAAQRSVMEKLFHHHLRHLQNAYNHNSQST